MAQSRDVLLAEIGRALRQVRPDRAEGLLQELEYATGRDPRPIAERTDPLPQRTAEDRMLAAILAAANRIEARLPWGRRVTWHVRVTPIVDTTLYVLGIEAEPIDERARAAVLASFYAAAFALEIQALATGGPSSSVPDWFFPRMRKLTPARELEADIIMHVTTLIAPGSRGPGEGPLPAAPARFRLLTEIAPAVRECFPGRAESLIEDVWEILAAPLPRARAVRHDGGVPGQTPRELALQIVDLMNAVEAEQPEVLRTHWSAAPAPADAIEMRATAA